MPKNYPQVIFVKIVEVVIFLQNFDFFQKKYRFLLQSDFIILTTLNGHNFQVSEKIERVGVFLIYFLAF